MTPQARLFIARGSLRMMERSLPNVHPQYQQTMEQIIANQRLEVEELERKAQQEADAKPTSG